MIFGRVSDCASGRSSTPHIESAFRGLPSGEQRSLSETSSWSVYEDPVLKVLTPGHNAGFKYTRLDAIEDATLNTLAIGRSYSITGYGGNGGNGGNGDSPGGNSTLSSNRNLSMGTVTPPNMVSVLDASKKPLNAEDELRWAHNSALDSFCLLVFKPTRVEHTIYAANHSKPPDRHGSSHQRVVIAQYGDTPTHTRTLNRLCALDPVHIILPATATEPSESKLFHAIDRGLPGSEMVAFARKHFNDVAGLAAVRQFGLDGYADALFKFVAMDGIMMIDPMTARNLELVYNLNNRQCTHSLFGAINNTKTSMGDVATLEARLDAVQALRGFLDIDHLISSLIQINRKQTIRYSEQAINNIIILKHILSQTQPLLSALHGQSSELLQALESILSQSSVSELLSVIEQVINKDAIFEKTAIGLRNQRCFAVRSGFNGLLDVARQTFKEATSDVHELIQMYSNTYGLPVKTTFTPSTQYQMHLTEDSITNSGKALPAEFINVTKEKKQIVFTSLRLLSQNDRIQESLTEVYLMGDTIVSDLTMRVRDYLPMLYQLSESVALLDMLVSFGSNAMKWNATRPEFTKTLAIKNGRHPIMMSMSGPALHVVPNDVFADSASRLQIITGPNMSGKSTYLRQIALLSILAQIGSFVPAEYISVRLVDCLFSRIGTDDNLEASSSSFMCEMRETAFILSNVTDDSLVIIDELGRGPRPGWGSDAPSSIHYCTQGETGGKSELSFSFKVEPGVSSISAYGLLAATSVGLEASILERARAISEQMRKQRDEQQNSHASYLADKQTRHQLQVAGRLVQLMQSCTLPDAAKRQLLFELQQSRQ
ncbi:hypothetical protein BSLG_003728 [Batrachochytrium salamandrivorans]|nr:hypothetical protein BSLG_003728 [Batrachochytrium salamandrivorans]